MIFRGPGKCAQQQILSGIMMMLALIMALTLENFLDCFLLRKEYEKMPGPYNPRISSSTDMLDPWPPGSQFSTLWGLVIPAPPPA